MFSVFQTQQHVKTMCQKYKVYSIRSTLYSNYQNKADCSEEAYKIVVQLYGEDSDNPYIWGIVENFCPEKENIIPNSIKNNSDKFKKEQKTFPSMLNKLYYQHKTEPINDLNDAIACSYYLHCLPVCSILKAYKKKNWTIALSKMLKHSRQIETFFQKCAEECLLRISKNSKYFNQASDICQKINEFCNTDDDQVRKEIRQFLYGIEELKNIDADQCNHIIQLVEQEQTNGQFIDMIDSFESVNGPLDDEKLWSITMVMLKFASSTYKETMQKKHSAENKILPKSHRNKSSQDYSADNEILPKPHISIRDYSADNETLPKLYISSRDYYDTFTNFPNIFEGYYLSQKQIDNLRNLDIEKHKYIKSLRKLF